MIIGHGSLSKLIKDRDGFMFFAAGIANSSFNGDIGEIGKEAARIGIETAYAQIRNEMFVYFSTISIYTSDCGTHYTMHKKRMEACVRNLAPNYVIIRIGNIWECTNPKTFLNVYKQNPKDFKVRDEFKFMISQKQLAVITDGLPKEGKHEFCVFGEMLKVQECLKSVL